MTTTLRAPVRSPARVGTALAVTSMLCVQLGMAASVGMLADVGPMGVAWLRLGWAGLILLVVVRPRLGAMSHRGLEAGVLLGVATAGSSLLFMAAVARLPLGTASALEFLGPLGIAVGHSKALRRMVWPALAGVGVLLMTQPWRDRVDLIGVGFALGAALCWAAYILLTQRVGDEVSGVQGLAVSMPVAALVATVVAAPSTVGSLTWPVVAWGLGLAILLPTVPFTLELLALRRLDAAAFGTLMSLEPAIALLVGLTLLDQQPGLAPVVGIGFVVAAGIGAERHGARPGPGSPDGPGECASPLISAGGSGTARPA